MSEAGEREALSLIHHHPGRLRVRAAAFRGGDAADRVRGALEAEPGVASIVHNPRTGSLLVEYQPGLADPDAILAAIAAAAGLDAPADDAPPQHREPGVVAIGVARELNELAYELTGYRADLRTVVPAGLTALAAYSFLASDHERMPRWDNLLYWSYNVFSQLHRREIEENGAERAPPREARAAESRPDDTSASGPRGSKTEP